MSDPHPTQELTAALEASGATMTRREGAATAARFHPELDDVTPALAAAAVFPLTWRAHVRATGKHRGRFLHNMTTCQVKALTPGDVNHGMVVDQRGKLVGRFVMDVREEDILLELDAGRREDVLAQLRRYIVADRVAFDAAEVGVVFSLTGPEVEARLEALLGAPLALDGTRWRTAALGGATVSLRRNARRLAQAGVDVTAANEDAPGVWEALVAGGFHPLGAEAWDQLRVARGIPRDGVDMGAENIPLESDYLTEDIDWDKGCYIGQEVIAMMHYRGRPNRHLRGLRLGAGAEPPAPGTTIQTTGGKDVGRTGTAVAGPGGGEPLALAVIKRAHAEPGTSLQLAGGVAATVVALPLGDGETPAG